ncbi:hypothetical protein ACJX0J_014861 [Zea mays]
MATKQPEDGLYGILNKIVCNYLDPTHIIKILKKIALGLNLIMREDLGAKEPLYIVEVPRWKDHLPKEWCLHHLGGWVYFIFLSNFVTYDNNDHQSICHNMMNKLAYFSYLQYPMASFNKNYINDKRKNKQIKVNNRYRK